MHELSVALSLLDEVARGMRRENASHVTRVHVRVGRLSGVSPDALAFAWEVARAGTVAERADLLIENVPLALYCAACDAERAPLEGGGFVCGTCGAPAPSVARGRELQLVAMEIAS